MEYLALSIFALIIILLFAGKKISGNKFHNHTRFWKAIGLIKNKRRIQPPGPKYRQCCFNWPPIK